MQNLLTQTDIAALDALACPTCRGRLFPIEPVGHNRCGSCRQDYEYREGIWRFLLPEQERDYRAFLENYRPARQADGWERNDDNYYLALPDVAPDDPQAALWRLRRRSYDLLMAQIGPGQNRFALDLGAGCGWLSRRLAEAGWQPIALDLNVEGRDGLEGGAVYLEKANLRFVRGQASMNRLPIAFQSVALCIVNGAFHYANPATVLPEIYRVLIPGGLFIMCDSPVYTDASAGQAMVAELATRLRTESKANPVWPDGPGYLLLDEMQTRLQQAKFKVELLWPERPWSPAKRTLRRLTHPKARQQARFPLFIARK